MGFDTELLGRYKELNSLQKLLAGLCADGANDEIMCRKLEINAEQVRRTIGEVHQELGLPAMANMYAVKQAIGNVHLQYRRWQEELVLGAPKDSFPMQSRVVSSPTSRVENESDDTGEVEADTTVLAGEEVPARRTIISVSTPARTGTPTVDELADKIDRLKEMHLTTLLLWSRAPRGEKGRVAKRLGISHPAFYQRLNNIYEKLGLADVPAAERNQLLEQGLARYRARQESASRAERIEPPAPTLPALLAAAPSVPAIVEQPSAPVQVDVAPVPTLERPQADLEILPVPSAHSTTPPQSGHGFGPGVLIPISKDVVNIDVVSGHFNGGEPTVDMAAAVHKRKHRGLQPAWLVLSPSNSEPGTTLAQVVFFEREQK